MNDYDPEDHGDVVDAKQRVRWARHGDIWYNESVMHSIRERLKNAKQQALEQKHEEKMKKLKSKL